MKMLFFSSDVPEVELVSREFIGAGIPCEVRQGLSAPGKYAHSQQTELWIHNDRDTHRALLLCVRLGLGFSRRPHQSPILNDVECEPLSEAC